MSEESVTAYVHASSGSTVRIRVSESTKAVVLANVPVNSAVKVLQQGDIWSRVVYGGKTGYMMSEFLGSDLPEQGGGIVAGMAKSDDGSVASSEKAVNTTSVVNSGAKPADERLNALEVRICALEAKIQ